MKTVSVICGGRGAATIIPELMKSFAVNAIVNAYDDGKSTGYIRNTLNILGPSDIRKVQELGMPPNISDEIRTMMSLRREISGTDEARRIIKGVCKSSKLRRWGNIAVDEIDARRGSTWFIDDAAIANLVYAGCILDSGGSITVAAERMSETISSAIDVIPVSDDVLWLAAVGEDGHYYTSEAEIVEERSVNRIDKLILHNDVRYTGTSVAPFLFSITPKISSKVAEAIRQSSIVVIAPGTVHSSIYPTLMHSGLSEALSNKIVAIITNAASDVDAPGYTAEDYVRTITKSYNCGGKRSIAICAEDGATIVDHRRVCHWCDGIIRVPMLNSDGKHDGEIVCRIVNTLANSEDIRYNK